MSTKMALNSPKSLIKTGIKGTFYTACYSCWISRELHILLSEPICNFFSNLHRSIFSTLFYKRKAQIEHRSPKCLCQQVQEPPSATTFTLQLCPPGLSHFTTDTYTQGQRALAWRNSMEKLRNSDEKPRVCWSPLSITWVLQHLG